MNPDDAKHAWQSSVAFGGPLPLEQVRAGADKLYRGVRLRNFLEYVACVVVVVASAYSVFTGEHLLHRIGAAMLVAGVPVVAWQLHRRASAAPPETAGAMPVVDFLRGQLVRQREALANVFWWYLLPILPGMAVMGAGNVALRVEAGGGALWHASLWLGLLALLVGATWGINQLGARKLQRHIDEIDALTGASE